MLRRTTRREVGVGEILSACIADRSVYVVPLSKYYHPPAPLPVEMRQGKVISTSVKGSSQAEVVSVAVETSSQQRPELKRKLHIEEKVEKKPRIDLNFGLDSDDDD